MKANEDLKNGMEVPHIESGDCKKSEILASVIANVIWQMDKDKKITALKQLQGHMWRESYEKGVIKGQYVDYNISVHCL